jgi:signal transduction histidine kinase
LSAARSATHASSRYRADERPAHRGPELCGRIHRPQAYGTSVSADLDLLEPLGRQLERLSATSHLCVPYRGRGEQFAVAAPFLRVGLQRRERCVYVEGDGPASELLAAMDSLGCDGASAVRSGALLTVPYPRPCTDEGSFDPERMIRWIRRNDDQARRAGFAGLRYAAEMTWALGPYPGVDRLAELESKLNGLLDERPMAVLCQYDRDRFPSEIVREMLATHPTLVARGWLCHNPFYVPPARYLSPDWPQGEIDWLLDSMNHLQRTDDALREAQERYRVLSRRLLEVQETDRRSFALELHDQLGQMLTAIRLTLGTLAGKDHVAEAIGLVDEAIDEVRSLALALRPSSLDDFGLVAALRGYLQRQAQRTGIDLSLEVGPGLEQRLPPPIETACFRLVQEALTNVARHSGARRVRVGLSARERAVEIAVRDDGKGFDVRAARTRAAAGESLGLLSMEERVALAGGRLEIESAQDRGTTVRATFPVPTSDTPA